MPQMKLNIDKKSNKKKYRNSIEIKIKKELRTNVISLQ